MSELIALLDGKDVGRVREQRGRLSFTYSNEWRDWPGVYPLSLSMPLAMREHPHSAIEPFLRGLLPDNEFVLQRWAAQFQVSARNAFRLIAEVGEDCAGAVQFVTPERLEDLHKQKIPQVQWLTETEVAARLRALKVDASATRTPRDLGQFSLAGAQPKTSLLYDGQRWGVPSGRTPTTHILKPTTAEFDGHAENEHFCLSLARAAGLPTATTEVRMFEEVATILVTRYDRVDTRALAAAAAARSAAAAAEAALAASGSDANGLAVSARFAADAAAAAADAEVMGDFSRNTPVYRVHQEDMCQALGLHPSRKYQNEGGPGPTEIIALLRASVGGGAVAIKEDIETFVKAVLFNWLIGGTDAHAKNYSILIGGGIVRLAPLYDIASILPYPHIDPMKAKLSMKIGDAYLLRDVGWRQWRKFAEQIRMPADVVVDMGRSMAESLPALVAGEHARARSEGLNHPVIDRLAETLTTRVGNLSAS
jgi:serine/threonine-protein kinase HipA